MIMEISLTEAPLKRIAAIPGLYYNSPIKYVYTFYDDVIKWKHSPRYWLFVRGIHRSPVNSPHKGQ